MTPGLQMRGGTVGIEICAAGESQAGRGQRSRPKLSRLIKMNMQQRWPGERTSKRVEKKQELHERVDGNRED